MTTTNNNYSFAVQDLSSNLALNKLKQVIDSFRNMKVLMGITCRPEFYEHIINMIGETIYGFMDMGVPLYKITNQKENIKYFYNKKELKEYLKNNI